MAVNLKTGSSGSDVKKLQQELINAGYNVGKAGADGVYGPNTTAAVKQYQKDHGLTVDGIAGQNTMVSLYDNGGGSGNKALNTLAGGAVAGANLATGSNKVNNKVNIDGGTAGGLNTLASGAVAGANIAAGNNGGGNTGAGGVKPNLPELPKNTDNGGTADNGGTTDNGGGDTATVGTPAPAYTSGTYGQSDIVNQAYALLDQHNASKPGAYQSQWDAQIKEYLDKIMNRDKFSYNFNEDALYQMYKDMYIQQGQMAMMDTMGQAAAMTGGYGNSYAQTVGQQAYNQQLSELNNIIPELYQMAFDQYAYEGDQLYNQYGLLMDQENMDYGRYMDSYNMWADERNYLAGRFDSERNFDYNQWSDTEDRKWNEYVYGNNMSYQQGRDQVSDQQWQTTFNEGVRQYEEGKTTGNNSNTNDKTTKYTEFDYEEQAKWDKEFKSAKTSDDLERVKTRMIQAGIDPEIAESWYNDYAKGFKPVVEEPVFSDAAKAFMSNLPYAHAGSSAEQWKQVVEKKLMAQYENGTLTEEDVEAIIIKLGL